MKSAPGLERCDLLRVISRRAEEHLSSEEA
jgi:hypothetical protein